MARSRVIINTNLLPNQVVNELDSIFSKFGFVLQKDDSDVYWKKGNGIFTRIVKIHPDFIPGAVVLATCVIDKWGIERPMHSYTSLGLNTNVNEALELAEIHLAKLSGQPLQNGSGIQQPIMQSNAGNQQNAVQTNNVYQQSNIQTGTNRINKFCFQCGASLNPGAAFCSNCGVKL